jgi:hypothetical protein
MSTDSKNSAVFQEGDDGEFVRVNSNDLWIRREKKKENKKPRKYPRRQLHESSAEGAAIGVVSIILVIIAAPAFVVATSTRNEPVDRGTAGAVCFAAVLSILGCVALVIVFNKLEMLVSQNKKLRARVRELEEQKAGGGAMPESKKKKSA